MKESTILAISAILGLVGAAWVAAPVLVEPAPAPVVAPLGEADDGQGVCLADFGVTPLAKGPSLVVALPPCGGCSADDSWHVGLTDRGYAQVHILAPRTGPALTAAIPGTQVLPDPQGRLRRALQAEYGPRFYELDSEGCVVRAQIDRADGGSFTR